MCYVFFYSSLIQDLCAIWAGEAEKHFSFQFTLQKGTLEHEKIIDDGRIPGNSRPEPRQKTACYLPIQRRTKMAFCTVAVPAARR